MLQILVLPTLSQTRLSRRAGVTRSRFLLSLQVLQVLQVRAMCMYTGAATVQESGDRQETRARVSGQAGGP